MKAAHASFVSYMGSVYSLPRGGALRHDGDIIITIKPIDSRVSEQQSSTVSNVDINLIGELGLCLQKGPFDY